MKTKGFVSGALLAAFLIATTGGVVYARQAGESSNDAVRDLALAKISLAQAVGQAEAHAGGKATKAELDSEHGGAVFQVEVVTAQNQVFDVQVDALDGTVLSSRADKADHADTADHDEKRKEARNEARN